MNPIILTQDLSKEYQVGGRRVGALDSISLTVQAGELIAVTGPSGSGKSTFLHILGCLDRPSSGAYWFQGHPVAGLADDALARLRSRHIGFVFQNFNLLPRASALENVELPLIYAGYSAPMRRTKGRTALERVGLEHRLHQAASTLSGGEQQRVAIARGLVNEPALILADEPTGALDSRTGQEILALLSALNATGITILIVTHDLSVAAHARRQVHVLDGRVASDRLNPLSPATQPGADPPSPVEAQKMFGKEP